MAARRLSGPDRITTVLRVPGWHAVAVVAAGIALGWLLLAGFGPVLLAGVALFALAAAVEFVGALGLAWARGRRR